MSGSKAPALRMAHAPRSIGGRGSDLYSSGSGNLHCSHSQVFFPGGIPAADCFLLINRSELLRRNTEL